MPIITPYSHHLLVPHPSLMPLLVPATISENYTDTKMMTDFFLSHYIEFIIASIRKRFFGW